MTPSRLPDGWAEAVLDEIRDADAPIVYGILQPGPDVEDGVPYVRPTEIDDGEIVLQNVRRTTPEIAEKYRRSSLEAGDLLLSIVGTIGKVARVPECLQGGNITQSSVRIRPRVGVVDVDYVRALLQSPLLRGQFDDLRLGTGVPRLNVGQVRTLKCRLAPLNEQQRIVARLADLQARSRRAREALEAVPPLLDRFRQSVLAAAFRGDLTAGWREKHPGVEPGSALLDRIRAERRRRWEEAELAKLEAKGKPPKDDSWKEKYSQPSPTDELPHSVPSSWTWCRWEEIGWCQNGRAFPSKDYQETGVRLLRAGNLGGNGQLTWTKPNTRHLPDGCAQEHRSHVVEGDQVVMNLTAQSLKDDFLGRVCLTESGERCLLNQRIARLTPIEVDPQWLFYLLRSPLFRAYVRSLNTGTLIQHMFTSQVDDFVLPLPPLDEQRAIAEVLAKRLATTRAVEEAAVHALGRLPSLEQSLLESAFGGELVPQAPADESAEVLLARIRVERDAGPKPARTRKNRAPG